MTAARYQGCPGHVRHWYSFYGHVRFRSPVCVRCGHPNPRPLTDEEWDELLDYRQVLGRPMVFWIEDVIVARKAAAA